MILCQKFYLILPYFVAELISHQTGILAEIWSRARMVTWFYCHTLGLHTFALDCGYSEDLKRDTCLTGFIWSPVLNSWLVVYLSCL